MLKMLKKFLILILLVVLLLLILKILNIENIILKKIYPTDYAEFVYKYSEKYDVDPLLIFSLIKAESNFNENVISSSKAMGLMQLMDSTAQQVAKNINCKIESHIFVAF